MKSAFSLFGANRKGAMEMGKSLAEEAGIDVTRCEFCEQPLDGNKTWKRGLDGAGAHLKCLERYL